MGSAACPRPDQSGRGGRGRAGGERGRHGRAGSPARCGSTHKAESQRSKKGLGHSLEEALGRSRGGLSTKVHLACDGKGRPLSVVLTPGQRHSSTQLGNVLDGIRVPRPSGIGHASARIISSLTKGMTSQDAESFCESRLLRIPSPSGATDASDVPSIPGDRRTSMRASMVGATW